MITPSLPGAIDKVFQYLQPTYATPCYPHDIDEHHHDDVHVHPCDPQGNWYRNCVSEYLYWEKIDYGNKVEKRHVTMEILVNGQNQSDDQQTPEIASEQCFHKIIPLSSKLYYEAPDHVDPTYHY